MQFGYYGKTVHKGDFVKFNLPQNFVNVWDDWIQQVLNRGESTHGNNWKEIYYSEYVIRYGFSAAIAGDTSWIGVMQPSEDKVGRKFPFSVALSLPHDYSPVAQYSALTPMFEDLENVVKQITDRDFDFNSVQEYFIEQSHILQEKFESLPNNVTGSLALGDLSTNLSIRVSSSNVMHTSSGISLLLDSVLKQTLSNFSIWQKVETSGMDSGILISPGMPVNADALALFDETWPSTNSTKLSIDCQDQGRHVEENAVYQSDEVSEKHSTLTENPFPPTESNFENIPNTETIESRVRSQQSEQMIGIDSEHYAENQKTDQSSESTPLKHPVEPIAERLELDDDATDHDPWED